MVKLPTARTARQYRLVVEQFELMGEEPQKKVILGDLIMPTEPIPVPRLVYTDIIPI